MMKKILTCLLAIALVTGLKAQEGFHTMSVGAEVALPLGNFSNAYNVGFGATGKVLYGISENGDITGTLGYMYFGIKNSNEYISGHMGMIPIVAGYRHSFGEWYAEPQLGLHIVSSKVKMDLGGLEGMFGAGSGSSSVTKLGIGLGGGYQTGDWDLGARFQFIDNLSFLGVRVAYNFAL